MNVIGWIKSHPLESGGLALGVIVALYFLGFFGGGSSSGSSGASPNGDPTAAAFFAAQSAEAASGNQLQAVQIEAQAQTAQIQDTNATNLAIQNTWAATNLQENTGNNATSISLGQIGVQLAPYQVQNNLITTLGNVASLPGQTVTSNSSDSGFFGIGASSSSSTSVVPNAAAVDAAGQLAHLTTSGIYAGH